MMEMISPPNWIGLVTLVVTCVVTLLLNEVVKAVARRAKIAERAPRDLRYPETRLDLQQLLAKANVIGSANVRDGEVLPAPDLAAGHPVLRVANAAVADFYRRSENPNAQMLYWRDPRTGAYALFGEFDVECVSDVIGMLSSTESN